MENDAPNSSGDIDIFWSKPTGDGQQGTGGSTTPAPASVPAAPATPPAADASGFDPSVFGDAYVPPAATGAGAGTASGSGGGAPAAIATAPTTAPTTDFDPTVFGDAYVPPPAPGTPGGPPAGPAPLSDWGNVLAKAEAEGTAGMINAVTNPLRNLVIDPLSTVGTELYDRLAPLWGGKESTPEEKQKVVNALTALVSPGDGIRHLISGTDAPMPGTPQIGDKMVDFGRALAGKVPLDQISADTPTKRIVEGAVSGAVSNLPFMALEAPALARGVVSGVRSALVQPALGAFSGGAGTTAGELAPSDLKKTASILTGLATGATPKALESAGGAMATVGKVVGKKALGDATTLVGPRVTQIDPSTGQPFTDAAGNPIRATQRAWDAATDRNLAASGLSRGELASQIEAAQQAGPNLPGVQNTVGQITRNTGLLRQEATLQSRGDNGFNEQRGRNNAALRDLVPGIELSDQDFELPGQIFNRRRVQLRNNEERLNGLANLTPADIADALGIPRTPEKLQVIAAHQQAMIEKLTKPLEEEEEAAWKPIEENPNATFALNDYQAKQQAVLNQVDPRTGDTLDPESHIAVWLQAATKLNPTETVQFIRQHQKALSRIQTDLAKTSGPGISNQRRLATLARNNLEDMMDANADLHDAQVARGDRAPEDHVAGTNTDLTDAEKALLDKSNAEGGPPDEEPPQSPEPPEPPEPPQPPQPPQPKPPEQKKQSRRPVSATSKPFEFEGKTPAKVWEHLAGPRPKAPNEQDAVQYLIDTLGGFRDLDGRAKAALGGKKPTGTRYVRKLGQPNVTKIENVPLVNANSRYGMDEAARELQAAGYFHDDRGTGAGEEGDLVAKLEKVLTDHQNKVRTFSKIEDNSYRDRQREWDRGSEKYETERNSVDEELKKRDLPLRAIDRHAIAMSLMEDPNLSVKGAVDKYLYESQAPGAGQDLMDVEDRKGKLTSTEFDYAVKQMLDHNLSADEAHDLAILKSQEDYLNGIAPAAPPNEEPATVAGLTLNRGRPRAPAVTPGVAPGSKTPSLFEGGGGGGAPPGPPVSAELRRQIRTAQALTRRNQRMFGNDPLAGVVGAVLKSGRQADGYKILRENVPRTLFNTSPASADSVMKMAGGDPAVAQRILGNFPAQDFMQQSMKNGKFDQAAAQKWIDDHADYFAKIPGMSDKFNTLAAAQRSAETAAADGLKQREDFEDGVASRLLAKNGEPLAPRDAVAAVARSPTSGLDTRQVIEHLRREGGEVAVNAWKRNVADFALNKMSLSTEATNSGTLAIGSRGSNNMLQNPRIEAMLEATFGPTGMKRFVDIAESVRQGKRTGTALENQANRSGTLDSALATNAFDGKRSLAYMAAVVESVGLASAALGGNFLQGAVPVVIFEAAKHLLAQAKAAGFSNVSKLQGEMLRNPDLQRAMAMQPGPNPKSPAWDFAAKALMAAMMANANAQPR